MSRYPKQFRNRFRIKAGKTIGIRIEADRDIWSVFSMSVKQVRAYYGEIKTPLCPPMGLRTQLIQGRKSMPGFWTRHLRRKLKRYSN